MSNVHFILGMGRSGTTLLLSMFNSIENNFCIPEIPSAMYLYNSHRNRISFSTGDAQKILTLKNKIQYIRAIKIDEKFFLKRTTQCKSYREFVETTYLSVLNPEKERNNIQNIIDKNPIYTFYSDDLLNIFPDAKFILMVRQPHSYVNSCLESIDPGKKRRSSAFYSFTYRLYAKEIMRINKRYQNQSLIIHYEDLVSTPENTLKSICKHLQIQYDPEMLEFYKKPNNFKENKDGINEAQRTRIKYKYGALSNPVNTHRIESWKEKLSQKDIDMISSITHFESEKLGYFFPKVNKRISVNFILSAITVKLYFLFARNFYYTPIWLREIFRIRV